MMFKVVFCVFFFFLSFYYYVVKETKRIRILLFVELYPYDNYDDFVVKIQIEINYKLDFFFWNIFWGFCLVTDNSGDNATVIEKLGMNDDTHNAK